MLVNLDIKGLEVVTAAQLSGDEVLSRELIEKQDIHANNQKAFNLGDGEPGRLVAKVLKFRILYGGTGYSFAKDPDFTGVSTSVKYWEGVIEQYYDKYTGIRDWHNGLLATVREQGFLEIPSGRIFRFEPRESFRGLEWPLTTIKNYPVQGLGADIVMLTRIEFARLVREAGITALIVMTVHDSIVVDCYSKDVEKVIELLQKAVDNTPKLCYTNWGWKFTLPFSAEFKVGMSVGLLKKIK